MKLCIIPCVQRSQWRVETDYHDCMQLVVNKEKDYFTEFVLIALNMVLAVNVLP